MNELALFAGAGGGILGGYLLGWRTVAAVEIEEYPRAVLLQRQADGILPRFPVWDDVRTFDGKPWRGKVDIITGGFPCQDISAAGKGAGITGECSGLWSEFSRIIGEVRPQLVLVENSPLLISRGLDTVLSDLAAMGYHAEWGIIGAHHVGAPHKRDRIWILAYAGSKRLQRCKQPGTLRSDREGAQTHGSTPERRGVWWDIDPAEMVDSKDSDRRRADGTQNIRRGPSKTGRSDQPGTGTKYRPTESPVGRVAHGVANRVDRLKAIGNGQVPAVAALAWEILTEGNDG